MRGALLLAAFLAADAADIDDDLPDLADQIALMASDLLNDRFGLVCFAAR